MTKLDQLVLDAVIAAGPDATLAQQILPYVSARRWFVYSGPVYASLIKLEAYGFVTSRWHPELPAVVSEVPVLRRRLYSATIQGQHFLWDSIKGVTHTGDRRS